MKKLSDDIDAVDKAIELRNFYIEFQKKSIANEIKWLEENEKNYMSLRQYFKTFYSAEKINGLTDEKIDSMVQMRGNVLFSQWNNLNEYKINTLPLKVIVQELKLFGK